MDSIENINKSFNDLIEEIDYAEGHIDENQSNAIRKLNSERPLKKFTEFDIMGLALTINDIIPLGDCGILTIATYLGAYLRDHITKESVNATANLLKEINVEILENFDEFEKTLLRNYDTPPLKVDLPKLCKIISEVYGDFDDETFSKKVTEICETITDILTCDGVYDYYSDNNHYQQRNRQIYSIKETNSGVIKTPKAIFSVENLIRYNDILGLSEPFYTLIYYHGYDEELKTIEKSTKEQILKQLLKEDLFNTTEIEAEKIFRGVRHSLHNLGLMEKKQTMLHRGFFIDENGKLISNTNIDGLTTTRIDLKEAFILLIELLRSNLHSEYKNATILRIILAMPFNYCIKQLGFAEDNTNGLIVHGEAKAGKTAICKIGAWFYLEEPYALNASADTLSSLTRMMNSTTFPTICDDSYELFIQSKVQNMIKKGMYEMYSRTVSDLDSMDVLKYKALSTPVFTYNENVPIIDGGLERRLKKIHYDKSNVLSKDESDDFKKKYMPFNKNSPLEKLHHIGIAFRDWIKPKLESNSEDLNDMESLTLEFFTETLADLGLEYAPLTTKYEYETNVEDYGGIIRRKFNEKLLRSKLVYTNGVHTVNLINVAKSGYFSWLKYQPKNERFVISAKDFVSACNKITNHSWNFKDLMSELSIADYDVTQIKVGGTTIAKATFIEKKDLAQNLLNINSLIDEDF